VKNKRLPPVKQEVVREKVVVEKTKIVRQVKHVQKNITINRYNVNTRYGRSYAVDRGFWAGFVTGLALSGHYHWYPHHYVYRSRWNTWYPPIIEIWDPPYRFYARHCYRREEYYSYYNEVYPPARRGPSGITQQQYKDIILERLTHTEEMNETALTPDIAWDAVEGAGDFGPNKVALLLMLLNNEVLLQGEDADDLWLWVTEQNNEFGHDISDVETDRIMNYLKEEVVARENGQSRIFEPSEPEAPAPVEGVPVEGPVVVPNPGKMGRVDIPWAVDEDLWTGQVRGDEYGYESETDADAFAQSWSVEQGNPPVATFWSGEMGRFYIRDIGLRQWDGTVSPLREADAGDALVIENQDIMNVFAPFPVSIRYE
jgi:hypothetical protein